MDELVAPVVEPCSDHMAGSTGLGLWPVQAAPPEILIQPLG